MMFDVALVKYSDRLESVEKALRLCGGLTEISKSSRVLIKPNIVLWCRTADFPKYGVITTARLIEDMVKLLREYGVHEIGIIEGMVEEEPNLNPSTFELAVNGMGLDLLKNRYGVKIIDVHKSTFKKVSMESRKISVASAVFDADYIINMPALKTHAQTVVSLGMKNLKGLLNLGSRKAFHHSPGKDGNLDYWLAKLPDLIPASLTLIDGTYSLEMGPVYTGRAHRQDLLIAARDLLAADKVGTAVLGLEPGSVPHLAIRAEAHGRRSDLNDVKIVGEENLESVRMPHKWALEQNKTGEMPMLFEKEGIKGVRFIAMDETLCTYCTHYISHIIMSVLTAKNRKNGFDNIEILYGRAQEPKKGQNHTILLGDCQVKKNGNNPAIKHCIRIKGCPPGKTAFVAGLQEAGIEVMDRFIDWLEKSPEHVHLKRYKDNPDFDDSCYKVGYSS